MQAKLVPMRAQHNLVLRRVFAVANEWIAIAQCRDNLRTRNLIGIGEEREVVRLGIRGHEHLKQLVALPLLDAKSHGIAHLAA